MRFVAWAAIRSPPSRATWSTPPAGLCVWRSVVPRQGHCRQRAQGARRRGRSGAEFGNSPRSIALAFDRFLAGKEAPGALNEEGDGAVRIMTVHASKGLEYPVVAVAECFGARKSSGTAQMGRVEGGAQVVALPARFDGVKLADGTFVKGDDVKKQFEHAFKGKGTSLWLPPELMEDVCATGSPAEAFVRLRNDDLQLSLEERARLLYVAMTRARELVILAMDAGVSRGKVTAPTFDVETDLTYDVLRRILPTDALDMPQLDADRLVFDNSKPGDYELISLSDFTFGEQAFEANASLDAEGRLVRGDAEPEGAGADARAAVPGPADPEPDAFELVYPQTVGVRMGACPYPARDSYSYSSIAAALHAESEDRAAEAHTPMDEAGDDAESDGSEMTDAGVAAVEPAGNPMALGSAFHAACQWLIEMGADALPAERADALARLWCLTPEQRERFDVAWTAGSSRRSVPSCLPGRASVPRCRSSRWAARTRTSPATVHMPRAPSTLGDEPGGFVTRAGHRLQDGRHTGRDAGTAAGEARPAGARLRRCSAQGGL